MLMKDKVLILIIIFLVAAIFYINFNSFFNNNNKSKQQDSSGQVKSAQINEKDYSFSEKMLKIPQKSKNFYNPDHVWSESYILLDVDSAHILAKKNETNVVPVASITKIMTSIIAIENYKLDEIVTVSNDAAYQTPSVIGLVPEEKITVKDLLYAILIKSGNDASFALAEHMGFDNFVDKMNQKAKYLGLENTNFKDPAGLDDGGHSSAQELAFLTMYALKYDLIREIIKTSEKTVTSINGEYEHHFENSNRLILNNEPLYYDPALGVKTGYTPDAGHCLVSAAQKNGHTLIAVVLKTSEDTVEASAKESKKLLEWGYENYIWNK